MVYFLPGAFFSFNGERYKILKAEIGNGIGHVGEVVSDNLEIFVVISKLLKFSKFKDKEKIHKKLVNLYLDLK